MGFAIQSALPSDVTEQEAIHRAMTREPVEWVAGLRRGVARELSGRRIFERPLSTALDTLNRFRRRMAGGTVQPSL